VLLGLAGIALGVYLWAFEAARPSSGSSGGISFAWLGYTLAVVLVVISSPAVGVGIWILLRPAPGRLGIGGAMGCGYGLIMLWLGFSSLGYERGRPFDPSTAIPFVVASLFLLAALMLTIALVTAEPPTKQALPRRRARRHPEQWQGDPRIEKPPPGYGTRQP
jgi:hypothetical protein